MNQKAAYFKLIYKAFKDERKVKAFRRTQHITKVIRTLKIGVRVKIAL